MEFCISAEHLRAALAEIEAAEKNGFKYCLAVFKLTSAGYDLNAFRASYSDLLEKAHPTSSQLNWGRFQGVSKRYKFKRGKLVQSRTPAALSEGEKKRRSGSGSRKNTPTRAPTSRKLRGMRGRMLLRFAFRLPRRRQPNEADPPRAVPAGHWPG